MKANQTMCALAIAEARKKGPRLIEIDGVKHIAYHLTLREIMDLHYREGFESVKTIQRRINLWATMPEVSEITERGILIVEASDYESCVAIEQECERTLCNKTLGCPKLEGAVQ